MMRSNNLLPRCAELTLDSARSKLAAYHFSQEALTKGERQILFIAEAVLRLVDEFYDKQSNAWRSPSEG